MTTAADIFEHTVDDTDDLTVTVDLANGTVGTFRLLPGTRLLLDWDEVRTAGQDLVAFEVAGLAVG